MRAHSGAITTEIWGADIGSVLVRNGWADYVFALHGSDQIGPKMLARIAKKTGLRPEDL